MLGKVRYLLLDDFLCGHCTPITATIFDGGIAVLLHRLKGGRNVVASGPLKDMQHQAFKAVRPKPELVRSAYNDFARAGVDVLTTSTVGLRIDDMRENRDEALEDIVASARLAREVALDNSSKRRKVRVAGCIPALPIVEDDGSDPAVVKEFQRATLDTIDAMMPYVDIWFVKDMESKVQATFLADQVCSRSVKPIWVSWRIQGWEDDHYLLPSGETLKDAVVHLHSWVPNIKAVMANIQGESHENAISELRKHTILGMDIVMGCYSDVEPEAQRKLGGFEGLEKMSEKYTEDMKRWWEIGARTIGTGALMPPEEIAVITGRRQKKKT